MFKISDLISTEYISFQAGHRQMQEVKKIYKQQASNYKEQTTKNKRNEKTKKKKK